jgi:hypothetical protein
VTILLVVCAPVTVQGPELGLHRIANAPRVGMEVSVICHLPLARPLAMDKGTSDRREILIEGERGPRGAFGFRKDPRLV